MNRYEDTWRLKEITQALLTGNKSPSDFLTEFYHFVDHEPEGVSKALMEVVEHFNEELAYYQPDTEVRSIQSGLYDDEELLRRARIFSDNLDGVMDST